MGISYSNPSGMTPAEREQAQQEARQEERQEELAAHQTESENYQRLTEEYGTSTPFLDYSLNGLKQMLASSNSGGIQGVAENWKKVHDQLVGSDGSGSGDCAYGQLKKAVDNVLEHWEGASANQFRAKANQILQNIYNTGTHCHTVSTATKAAAQDLQNQKGRLDALEEPSWFDRAGDFLTDSGRDGEYTQQQIQNKDLPKDVLAEIEEDYLSEGMEVKLQAASIMETLGRSYVVYKDRIKPVDDVNDKDGIPPSNPSTPMPTPIPAFSGSTATPGASRRGSYTPSSNVGTTTPSTVGPRDRGITGGKQVPYSKTQLDTVKPGLGGPAETLPGGGTTRTPGPGGGTTSPGANTGIPGGGMLGGTRGGGRNTSAGGPRAGIRGAGSGTTTGRGAARGGFRGMGAMGGGGAGGGRASGTGGRGPLARAKGGVAGAPKGIVGGRPATPGGTGLGKGRGGASGSGSGKGRGMLAGAARGSNQRPGEEENEQLARPDYLVEDEETWTPEDNRSTPGTIE